MLQSGLTSNKPPTKGTIIATKQQITEIRRLAQAARAAQQKKRNELRGELHRLAQQSRDRTNPEFNRVPITSGFCSFTPLDFGFGTGGGVRVIRSTRGLSG